MRLGPFILVRVEDILSEWESFARTLLPAAAGMNREALRDHAAAMLSAIAKDLSQGQTSQQQVLKSHGLAPLLEGAPPAASHLHATLRAQDGFSLMQLTSEYRALRASVLRLWAQDATPAAEDMQDVIRFNEAIDQALAESVESFSTSVEQSRNLLLGMLGHDMRSPLSVVVTTAHYLTRLNAGAEVSTAANRLINSGARIQALVDDLVDFSRTQLGAGIKVNPTEVDLQAIFKAELEILRAAHRDRVVELEVSGDVHGKWDGNRLRQVLGNLVTNALKYGHPHRPVEVRLSGETDRVVFRVENEGPSVSPEAVEGMFEPLARGPVLPSTPGADEESLGLGLYIARAIAVAHRGSISARSDDAKTVFEVQLPR